MKINDSLEFQALILKCGLREKAQGDLREILDCVTFYSEMCACTGDAKIEKLNECNMRYRNFLKYNLKSVSEEILRYEPFVDFYLNDEFITRISN